MNYNSICPVCHSSNHLNSFGWGEYNVIHCNLCGLDYCGEMIKKEAGGNSSPVDIPGIEMMSYSFFKTQKLAKNFSMYRKQIYEKLIKRNCEKILEVGCGPGVFYKPWLELNVDWTGIEINPYWIEFGQKNGVPVINKSMDSIKEKFDVVIAHQVIEHVENPVEFMNNIKYLLKPGGIVHLELPNQFSLSARLRKISPIISNDYGFIQPPMHLRAYSKKTIKFLFDSLDFKSKMLFVCGNTDRIWGQVREYSVLQNLFYSLSGKMGIGSLLIGIAKLR